MSLLRVHGIEKRFGTVTALAGIHLELDQGEVLALVGPNGAGKSTLLRIIAGLSRPSAGQLEWAIQSNLRSGVGYVGHQTMLYPELTGRENLRLFTRLFGLSDYDGSINEVSIKMGLSSQLDQKVSSLSHGMRKRMDIARAMLHKPLILLLDEPESGLDPQALELLSSIVEDSVKSNCTVVMTTHNLGWASSLATHIAVLSRGTIVHHSLGSPQESSKLDSIYKKYSGINR